MSELEQAKKILEYWYNTEYFTPFFPKQRKGDVVLYGNIKQDLPWANGQDGEIFNVYIGKIRIEELTAKLHDAMNLEEPSERENFSTCVAKLKFNYKGKYIKGSFRVNPFLYATTSLINARRFNIQMNEGLVDTFNEKVDNILKRGYPEINDQEKLLELEDLILSQLDYLSEDNFYCVIRKITESTGENILEEVDPDEYMCDSLYVRDISMVLNNLKENDNIIDYITAKELENRAKIEIDKDVEAMRKWTFPDRYPMGKWPSKQRPNLMEQIEINVSISEDSDAESVFSVDSKVGIKKPILLREIIANNIVQRAVELAKYEDPNSAFTMNKLKNPTSDFYKTYYEFPSELEKYSIIVASNDSSLAENMSVEIQNAFDVEEGKTYTGNFDINNSGEVYFSDVATKLFGKSSWGLISVPLANEENIKRLRSLLNTNKNQPFGSYFNNELKIADWGIAKEGFIRQYNLVKRYQAGIVADVKKVYALDDKIEELTKLQKEQQRINKEISEKNESIAEIAKMEKENFYDTELVCANMLQIETSKSFFKRLASKIFKKSKSNQEIRDLKEKHKKLLEKQSELEDLKANIESEIPKDLERLKDNEEKFNVLKAEYDVEVKVVQEIEVKYGHSFANSEFFESIDSDNIDRKVCPWTNAEYDKLREELFYRALILQKSFVQNAKGVKQNIRMLCKAWDVNIFFESDRQEFYKHVFNTLFLVIPVISTNFDFTQKLLEHIGKEELGTLIVDETEQVEPRSVVGALWRTRKAIVGELLPVDMSTRGFAKNFY